MVAPSQKLALDTSAWASNVFSSVLIIFINKVLMSKTGYGFQYATTLCALHYLACTLSMTVTSRLNRKGDAPAKKVSIPSRDLVTFVLTANASIISLNLSLMLNKVGFYQIAKLLIIPFVCLVEKFWLGRKFTPSVVTSILVVVLGVAIVTVTDSAVESNILGVVIAALSVVSSGMQQIFVRTLQQQHRVSSNELLGKTAPLQGWSLLLIGPVLDRNVTGKWVFGFDWSTPALAVLCLSCSAAIFVNLSQFACLGRFSAVSFQVLGHMKTVCVLLGGWAFLGDHISLKQFLGMLTAVAGMVLYGFATLPGKPKDAELPLGSKLPNGITAPLLAKARSSGSADDEATGVQDGRVDITLRGLMSPNRASSPRHKLKSSDAV